MIIGMCILILLVGCSQVPSGFIIERNITQSCKIRCDSGYFWDGNGTCIYNGTHDFEIDNCTVSVTEIEKGNIGEYYD